MSTNYNDLFKHKIQSENNSNNQQDHLTIDESNKHNLKILNKALKLNSDKMFLKYLNSILFILTILIWLFYTQLSYSSSNEIIYKQKQTFFQTEIKCKNHNLNLIDSFDGSLYLVADQMDKNQFQLIYLYADWCARSLQYKDLIEKLACNYSKQLSFSAINCFIGDCKKHFNLIKYPQILIQIRDVGLFAYKGPFDYTYLINYLNLIQKPIERIDNFDHFIEFIKQNDGAVVANFNFQNKTENEFYKIYYQAAVKSINSDFENPIRYGIVLNKTLWSKLSKFQTINSTENKSKNILQFSSYGFQKGLSVLKNVSSDSLNNWVYKHIKRSIKWYYPDKNQILDENLNKFLIFVPNRFDQKNNKIYSIVKYFELKNHISSTLVNNKFLNFILNEFESNYINNYCKQINIDLFIENLNQLKCPIEFNQNDYFLETFLTNTKFLFVDLNLYSNYAHKLLDLTDKVSNNLLYNQSQFTIMIDYKNESIYNFDKEFNYQNLNQFIRNHSFGLNKRILKSKQIEKKSLKNIIEINSKELIDLFDNKLNSNSVFNDKDLLLFYFNNYCGSCKLVNFNLINLIHKYFESVESFQVLKIDVASNDLPFHLQVQQIPSILFIPGSNLINKQKETILYDYSNDYELKNLVKFILDNSKNSKTIIDFIKSNFMLKKRDQFDLSVSSKLRYDLISLISNKIAKLETESDYLNLKNISLNHHEDSKVYSNKINTYIKSRLDKNKFEIELLKEFLIN